MRSVDAGRSGAVSQHDVHAGASQGDGQAAARLRPASTGRAGATQNPALTAPRKASANSIGSLMTRPMVEQATGPDPA